MDLLQTVLVAFLLVVTECRGELYLQPAKTEVSTFTRENFFVTCMGGSGTDQQSLTWKGPDGNRITDLSGRIHIEPPQPGQSDLKLVVEEAWESDKGTYTCSAPAQGEEISFNLIVYRAITFEGTPQLQQGTEGEDFTLQCSAQAEHKPVVSWTRDSKSIVNNKKYKMEGQSLVIHNLSRHDAGNYTCSAFLATSHLSSVKSMVVTLQVNYPAEWKQPIQDAAYSSVGAMAVLHCEAGGVPEPSVNWFRDDQLLEPDERRQIVGDTGASTLKIKVTGVSDFGEYMCRARNDLNVLEHVITLKEGEAPKPPRVAVVDSKPSTLVLKIEHPSDEPLQVVGFRVEYKTDKDSSWESAEHQEYDTGNGMQYVLRNLNHDTSYAIRVSARNAAGYGDFSDEIYHRTKDPQHYTQHNTNAAVGVAQIAPVLASLNCLLLLRL
ncbi:hypothetical protein MTO96_008652 [Rhipicephalus appendiculatus]|uniref:Neural cell adhesion molecule l1 n=1 Tax=Rhipicephalus appendiculatus TaxID=34631 RepID=A0A131YJX5_RHIAP